MADEDRITGKQSWILIEGVYIPITRYSARFKRNMEDMTSSEWYSPDNGLTMPVWEPTSICTELSIRGMFRFSVVPDPILTALFIGYIGEVEVSLGLDAGSVLGEGFFQLFDFEINVPCDDVVEYECNAQSQGRFKRITDAIGNQIS